MLNAEQLPQHTMLYHICAFTEGIPVAGKVLPVLHPTLLKPRSLAKPSNSARQKKRSFPWAPLQFGQTSIKAITLCLTQLDCGLPEGKSFDILSFVFWGVVVHVPIACKSSRARGWTHTTAATWATAEQWQSQVLNPLSHRELWHFVSVSSSANIVFGRQQALNKVVKERKDS